MRWRDWREAGAQSAIITVALTSASSSGNWFGAFDGLSTTETRPNGSFRTIKTTTAPAHTHGVTGSTGAAGTGSTGTTGGGKPFDNRPAYQDVHAWRRTA